MIRADAAVNNYSNNNKNETNPSVLMKKRSYSNKFNAKNTILDK